MCVAFLPKTFFLSLGSIILLHKFPFATDLGMYQFSAASVSNSLSTERGICVQILSCLIKISVVCHWRLFRYSVINDFFTSFTQSALIHNILFHDFSVEVVCSNYLILSCQMIPSVYPLISPNFSLRYDHSFVSLPFYLQIVHAAFSFLTLTSCSELWTFLFTRSNFGNISWCFRLFVIILSSCPIGVFW